MPLDIEGLKLKLQLLEEYINDVKKLRTRPESEFVPRSDTEILAERHIEKACQAVLDIANHIIAEEGLGAPTMYRELGPLLAQHEIVTADMAKKMGEIASFRNRLVHEYATLDPQIVFRIVHHDIDDLVVFAQEISIYLEKREYAHEKQK